MKRDKFLVVSAANYVIKLLDESLALWEEEMDLKQQLQSTTYLKKLNDKETMAACKQLREVLREVHEKSNE